MACLKLRQDQLVPVEKLDLALELSVRYAHSFEHHRARAEYRLLSTPMVSGFGVWIDSNPGGIDMDDCVPQVGDVMEKLVVGDLCNVVRFRDGYGPINGEPNLCQQTVSHEVGTDLGHGHDTIHRCNCRRDASDD